MCWAEKGELPEAIRLLQDLVTQVPYYTLAYVDLGVCNEKQALRLEQELPSADRAGTADYYKKAEYYYKKALSLQRNCRPARYNLQRLWQEGKIDSLKNTVPKNGMPSLPDKP
jgi:tetratricopeptide (TPR) repeat protein